MAKTIDSLMKHLREEGIDISGSAEKRKLINVGYFYGYKGYRFFKSVDNKVPYSSFSEIKATIDYDNKLKTLFYPQIMFIETAFKNISLEVIIQDAETEQLREIYDRVVLSYNNCPDSSDSDERKKYQVNRMRLQDRMLKTLSYQYSKGNPKVTHYYNSVSYGSVPLWSLFEVITMGDYGTFVSSLIPEVRKDIQEDIGISTRYDTNFGNVYKIVFILKDLRNAVAHNSVVFDARFRTVSPTKAVQKTICEAIGLPYINFKTICDYVLLIGYILNLLGVTKTEKKAFIRDYEYITSEYIKKVSPEISQMIVPDRIEERLCALKSTI